LAGFAAPKASDYNDGVLSEEEKAEMREMAASITVRDEFRLMRNLSRERQRRLSLDAYIRFLTAMSRLRPGVASPRPFIEYTNVKL
jgi:hypothetical protein